MCVQCFVLLTQYLGNLQSQIRRHVPTLFVSHSSLLCLFIPYGRDVASFRTVLWPYKHDTKRLNNRFHGSTSIVLQEAPQLTTPPVFSRNDQSSTPHSPSAMLPQPRCPYCRQQAPRPTFCSRLTLQRTSLLALPQDPSPSCSILSFMRPSFADHLGEQWPSPSLQGT